MGRRDYNSAMISAATVGNLRGMPGSLHGLVDPSWRDRNSAMISGLKYFMIDQ